MYRLLAEQGVDPSGHRARRLDRRMARAADLILVPERSKSPRSRLEPTTRGKVHLLGKWGGLGSGRPVWRSRNCLSRESFGLIERLVLGWLNKIC